MLWASVDTGRAFNCKVRANKETVREDLISQAVVMVVLNIMPTYFVFSVPVGIRRWTKVAAKVFSMVWCDHLGASTRDIT